MADGPGVPHNDGRLNDGQWRWRFDRAPRVSRRGLLIGGGAAVGLMVGWTLWPRDYLPGTIAADREQPFGVWLKIGSDGQVIVFVPQSEMGQGSFTQLAQIVVGELGGDWRTVGVQPAQPSALFTNMFLARQWAPAIVPAGVDGALGDTAGKWAVDVLARRNLFMVTAGSSSVRAFEQPAREAGAAARTLLAMAAAEKWNVDWQSCAAEDGFIISGSRRARFAELAEAAAGHALPDSVPLNASPVNMLSGRDVPRLDLPAKVDGTAAFAGDIRLPDMVYAAISHGPVGAGSLQSVNIQAARAVAGYVGMVRHAGWVAAAASNWWAADRALKALRPVFAAGDATGEKSGPEAPLRRALDNPSRNTPLVTRGDPAAPFAKSSGTRVLDAEYQVAPAVHSAAETRTATARLRDGRLELWLATQAPQNARQIAADALGIGDDKVVLYPMLAGGSFGRNLDNRIAAEVALMARDLDRPVHLCWSRAEDLTHHHFRAPAMARMSGAVDGQGLLVGLQTRIAVPATAREQMRRLIHNDNFATARAKVADVIDALAVEGAPPPYDIANFRLDHVPVDAGMATGRWRSNSHSYTAFFTECFVDELAGLAGVEPLSFRMQMLSGQTRLARCLSGVAAMAGWDGGVDNSGMGIACHSLRGSHIAVVVKARTGAQGIKVERISAMADCGRMIHAEIARQQIEGGIIFGLAQALGAATGFEAGQPTARRLRDLRLPQLADVPEVQVEFIRSNAAPGGIGEVGVPAVAPAIANAVASASGVRLRTLPLLSRDL